MTCAECRWWKRHNADSKHGDCGDPRNAPWEGRVISFERLVTHQDARCVFGKAKQAATAETATV